MAFRSKIETPFLCHFENDYLKVCKINVMFTIVDTNEYNVYNNKH